MLVSLVHLNNSLSLSDFMSSLNLSAVDCLFSSILFTYMRDDGSATFWVDHFLCSEQLVSSSLSLFVDLAQTFLIIIHLLLSLTVPLTLLPILHPCPLPPCLSLNHPLLGIVPL